MAQPIYLPQSQVDNRRSFIGRLFWLAATLLLVIGAVSWSQAATGAVETNYKVSEHGVSLILPEEVGPTFGTDQGEFRQGDRAPVALYNVRYDVAPAGSETMARQYLRENAGRLQLSQPDLADLRHHATQASQTGLTVRFRQFQAGVPVYKGEVVVHINNSNQVSFVTSNYRPVAADLNVTPTLTAAAARQNAFDHIGVSGALIYDVTALTVYAIPGQTRLAYQVRLETDAPAGSWEVIVDAHSGDLLKVHDDAFYNVVFNANSEPAVDRGGLSVVDGTAFVFDPDPLTSATAIYNDPGFTDGSDATTTQLDGERYLVTLKDIQYDGSDNMHRLIGPWAENVDWAAPFKGDFAQVSSAFLYNRFDDAFEAANTYYHIDDSMRYLNITITVPIVPFAYATGVRFDPHGFNGADNSSYSSGTQRLQFGEGGVDDAEDSDVVHHELGHGLHDWVTSGSLSQVNGLSEGSGDYWAQSYNRSIDSWTPGDPQYNWVFRWDGHNPFWPGRVTNYGPTYPGGLTGQIHTDGQIWATCMMKVWDAVGKVKTDTAFWEGLRNTNSSTSQQVAANAVFQAAIDLGYTNGDLIAMRNEMLTCGYDMQDLPIVYTEFVHLPAISQE